MTANKLWIIVLALASVVVVALGWTVGVQPQIDSAVAADQQRIAVVSENAKHAADLAQLKEQFEDIASLRRELAELRQGIPARADDDGVVDMIDAVAAQLGVTVVSVNWGESTFYQAAVSAGVAAPVAPPTGDEAEGDSATPPPVVIPSEDPTAGVVQVAKADVDALTAGSLVALPVSITVNADSGQLLQFITRLSESKRLFLVTGATLTPGSEQGPGASTIDGLVYFLPGLTGANPDDNESTTQSATTSG